jgi:hypothetical protein
LSNYATAYKTDNVPAAGNVYESTENSQMHDSLTMIEDLFDQKERRHQYLTEKANEVYDNMCGNNWEQPTHRTKIQESIDEKPDSQLEIETHLAEVDMECIEKIKAKRLERIHRQTAVRSTVGQMGQLQNS